ncbi:GNAT family N-acetyltransferase [Arthrobacter sp. TMN-37]
MPPSSSSRDPDDGPAGLLTARLALRPPRTSDLAELHALYADPQVWGPDPLSRHSTPVQTERMIGRWQAGWDRNGLGMWLAHSTVPGTEGQFVGIGGCTLRHDAAWNLGFRLSPAFWGLGYAQEIIGAAVSAARRNRPDLPITAYLLEGNERSRRTTEGAGLRFVWRGPDAGNPNPGATRLLYADRPLAPALVEVLTAD